MSFDSIYSVLQIISHPLNVQLIGNEFVSKFNYALLRLKFVGFFSISRWIRLHTVCDNRQRYRRFNTFCLGTFELMSIKTICKHSQISFKHKIRSKIHSKWLCLRLILFLAVSFTASLLQRFNVLNYDCTVTVFISKLLRLYYFAFY